MLLYMSTHTRLYLAKLYGARNDCIVQRSIFERLVIFAVFLKTFLTQHFRSQYKCQVLSGLLYNVFFLNKQEMQCYCLLTANLSLLTVILKMLYPVSQ